MAILKVVELMTHSEKGWEDAAQKAVAKAGESIKDIRSVWMKDFSATVGKDGKINSYRVTCKISFEVND